MSSVPIVDSTKLLQFAPQDIKLYSVQEAELITIAKGADSLPMQICLTALGVFFGALPGGMTALSQFSKDGKMEGPYLATLILCVSGLAVGIIGGCIHYRQKTYPEQLLKDILSRKHNTA